MKIIDVNLSIGGKDSIGKTMDLPYVLELMQEYRIDHGICYHQHALLDPKDGNVKMAVLAGESSGKLSTCVVLDPILGAENLPGEGSLQERLMAFPPPACVFSLTLSVCLSMPFIGKRSWMQPMRWRCRLLWILSITTSFSAIFRTSAKSIPM